MRKIIYECEQCKKTIGDKRHITMVFAHTMNGSGIAVPPSKDTMEVFEKGFANKWTVAHKLNGQFMHWCSSMCLKNYFDVLLKTP